MFWFIVHMFNYTTKKSDEFGPRRRSDWTGVRSSLGRDAGRGDGDLPEQQHQTYEDNKD